MDGVQWTISLAASQRVLAEVVLIALLMWVCRSFVQSDPDPLYLNLTFFAFTAQCLRTVDFAGDGANESFLIKLLAPGALMVLVQVRIMQAHMKTTLAHYQALLRAHRMPRCSDGDVAHWASILLLITGVDFAPGSYGWLRSLFDAEPREKRRIEAFSILPKNRFRVDHESGLTADALTVPLERRRRLWFLYVFTFILSWTVFVIALVKAQK